MADINTEQLIIELRKGIVAWYPFSKNSKILCIELEHHTISDYLMEKGFSVDIISHNEEFAPNNEKKYDYIVCIGMLERCFEPVLKLKQWKTRLKDSGKLLLGMDNRLGIKYFCGDKDPFTEHALDGIENYRFLSKERIKEHGGRNYAKNEIVDMLCSSGFCDYKFYSVLPNLTMTQFVYAEDYLPNEELGIRFSPKYNSPDTIFLEEEWLYSDLIKNGMFHTLADSFFIECCNCDKDFTNIKHATLSMERGKENAFATIIMGNNTVKKSPIYKDGLEKINKFITNNSYLNEHGIETVEAKIQNDEYIMPYVDAVSLYKYMQNLLSENTELFIEKMDYARSIILKSSECIGESELGVILKRGYIDLIPWNAFYIDGNFIFYDQEFYLEDLPANVILFRWIREIYDSPEKISILHPDFFYNRYGMKEHLDKIVDINNTFIKKIRNEDILRKYHNKYSRNWSIFWESRWQLNTPAAYTNLIYKKVTKNPIPLPTENKEFYIFGSGKIASKFMLFYGYECNIAGVLDNNPEKWGTDFYGAKIMSPNILRERNPSEYKITICVVEYKDIFFQLSELGITDITLYLPNCIYPGRQLTVPCKTTNDCKPQKKYHIGYVAGVFDLFHIGHINLLRRAKEQCDYLIVGVTSDEYIEKLKQREVFVPFEDRIEIVRCCKYVDEAVPIPFEYGGTVDAFRKYHFDVQFSGSDYVDNPWWLEQQKFLRENGADLVFLSYTEKTSSTKIKELINKKLV